MRRAPVQCHNKIWVDRTDESYRYTGTAVPLLDARLSEFRAYYFGHGFPGFLYIICNRREKTEEEMPFFRKVSNPAIQYFKNQYRRAQNWITAQLHHAKQEYFQNLNPSDVKHFWKTIKILNKQNAHGGSLTHNGTSCSSDSDKPVHWMTISVGVSILLTNLSLLQL